MPTETNATPLTVDHKQHATFFRQSGWLMISGIIGGAMTFGLHFLNKKIPDAEYAIFVTLTMMTACVPAVPLQMVFAQQAAEALAMNRVRQLAGMIRLAWIWTFVLWLVVTGVILLFQGAIIKRWQLPDAWGLWMTLPAVLAYLWMPLFFGVLQGRQDFFWLGWSVIIGGFTRIVAAALVVFFIRPTAAGLMMGILVGFAVSALIGIWRTRDLWSQPSEPFDVKSSLGKIIPLMIGFGASQFMFTSDTLFAKAFFSNEALKPYGAAGTLSRALLWLVLPLASVMFPKIVHSHAKSEKSNLFGVVVLGTGLLTACGALGLWIVGPLVVRFVFRAGDVDATVALLPWYGGAMIPLALANVLVNDLLARSRFGVVTPMIILAIVYSFVLPMILHRFPGRLEVVLQTLTAANSMLLVICIWFKWGPAARTKAESGG